MNSTLTTSIYIVLSFLLYNSAYAYDWGEQVSNVFINSCITSANESIDNYIKTNKPDENLKKAFLYRKTFMSKVCNCSQKKVSDKFAINDLRTRKQEYMVYAKKLTSLGGDCNIEKFIPKNSIFK